MRRALMPALATLALASGGCGGNDDDSLTKEELADRASEICNEGEKDLEDVKRPTERSEVIPYLEGLKEIADRATSEMRDLEPPAAVRATWEDFVGNYGTGSRELAKVVQRVKAGDQRALVGFDDRIQGLATRERNLARELGATGCTD